MKNKFRCSHCNSLINKNLRTLISTKMYLFEFDQTLKSISIALGTTISTIKSDIDKLIRWMNHPSFPLRNIYSNMPCFQPYYKDEIKNYINNPENKCFRDDFVKLIEKEIKSEEENEHQN